MAFSSKQTKKARAGVVIAALGLAAILLVVVLSGALTPQVSTSSSAQEAQSGSTTAASSTFSGSSSSSISSIDSMDDVDAMYGAAAKQLAARYAADADNPATLLNLANAYFDWGVAAMEYVESDENQTHVVELFQEAIDNYDAYLADNPDSKSAVVDRAICVFYTGDADSAIETLEDFTTKDDTFGPAWANLGMFYENADRIDDAKLAYQKAIEADPDDAYQVKTYAEERLAALNES